MYKAMIQQLLKTRGYKGNEMLMFPETGSIDTARNWAQDCIENECECMSCNECENGSKCFEHEYDHDDCKNAEQNFHDLIHVRKSRLGHYEEVKY